jgi:hypothetical protein
MTTMVRSKETVSPVDASLQAILALRNSGTFDASYVPHLAENAYTRDPTLVRPDYPRETSARMDGFLLDKLGNVENAVHTAYSTLRLARTIFEQGSVRLPLDSISHTYPDSGELYLRDMIADNLARAGITRKLMSQPEKKHVIHPNGMAMFHGAKARGSFLLEYSSTESNIIGTLSLESITIRDLPEFTAEVIPAAFFRKGVHAPQWSQNLDPEPKDSSVTCLPADLNRISVYTKDRYGHSWSIHCKGPMEVLPIESRNK